MRLDRARRVPGRALRDGAIAHTGEPLRQDLTAIVAGWLPIAFAGLAHGHAEHEREAVEILAHSGASLVGPGLESRAGNRADKADQGQRDGDGVCRAHVPSEQQTSCRTQR